MKLVLYFILHYTCVVCRNLPSATVHDEEKFIVFKSCLWQLFEQCNLCTRPCLVETVVSKGSMVVINQQCPHCQYQRSWSSQPMIGNTPAGNVLLSAAILFNGASYTKVLRVLEAMKVVCISPRTFQDHAQMYLQPTIWHGWTQQQQELIQGLVQLSGEVILGGDGRCDSPGHCAKYLSYTMIELTQNKVIDIQLVQVKNTL